jgi:hypothetical protein
MPAGGMTKAEVLALGDKKPDLVEENALTYKTTLMDNAFLVVYTFDKDGKLFQLAYATIDKNRQKAYGPMKKYLEDMKYKDVMTLNSDGWPLRARVHMKAITHTYHWVLTRKKNVSTYISRTWTV